MFDALFVPHTIGAPWTRTVVPALLLHSLVILLAVTSTASAPEAAPPVTRDTIRLELTAEAQPRRVEAPPPPPEAAFPRFPRVPALSFDAPEFQLPRLSYSLPAQPESGPIALGRDGGQSEVADDSSHRLFSTVDLDQLPELAEPLHPRYPEALRRAGVSGLVQVQYVVRTDGRMDPRSLRVLASSHPAFLLAALQALRDARFKPARQGGVSTATVVKQTIRFRYQ
jgi:protein TonB